MLKKFIITLILCGLASPLWAKDSNFLSATTIRELKQLLIQYQVVSTEQLAHSASIVAPVGEHLIVGNGDAIYIKGIDNQSQFSNYYILQQKHTFLDSKNKAILGYAVKVAGVAQLSQMKGNMATALVTKVNDPIHVGDHLVPQYQLRDNFDFSLHSPQQPVKGQIVALLGDAMVITNKSVVVINQGRQAGLEPGHVLTLYSSGKAVSDPTQTKAKALLTLPDQAQGQIVIFRSYPNLSLGIVTNAVGGSVKLQDNVAYP